VKNKVAPHFNEPEFGDQVKRRKSLPPAPLSISLWKKADQSRKRGSWLQYTSAHTQLAQGRDDGNGSSEKRSEVYQKFELRFKAKPDEEKKSK